MPRPHGRRGPGDRPKYLLFQEDKLKSYYNDLHWALNEYDRVVSMVIPVTAMVFNATALQRHGGRIPCQGRAW